MRRAVPRAREGRSQDPLAVDVQHMKLEAHIKAEITNARPYPRHRGDPHLAELRHQVLAPPGKALGARRVCASDTPVLCLFEFGTEERSDDGRWRLPF